MAYVPEQQVKELWDEMGDNKDWGTLKDVLTRHPEIGKNLEKNMSGKLQMVADRMKNRDFPSTPEELSQILAQRLATWDNDSHPTIDDLSA